MRINEQLNLTMPLYGARPADAKPDDPDPIYAYVHSMPISREAFEASWMLLSKTFTVIYTEVGGQFGGGRVAALALRDVAKSMAGPRGDAAALSGPILAEIHRMTNVLLPTGKGWESVPYEDALNQGMIAAEDLVEVENAIVFFTVSSAMVPRKQWAEMGPGAVRLWGADVSSLKPTEFAASLQTSTEAGTTPAKSTAPVLVETPRPRAVVEVGGARRVSSLPV